MTVVEVAKGTTGTPTSCLSPLSSFSPSSHIIIFLIKRSGSGTIQTNEYTRTIRQIYERALWSNSVYLNSWSNFFLDVYLQTVIAYLTRIFNYYIELTLYVEDPPSYKRFTCKWCATKTKYYIKIESEPVNEFLPYNHIPRVLHSE